MNTFADWRITVWGGRRYDKVPDACCKDETFGCGYCFVDADKTLNKKVDCLYKEEPTTPNFTTVEISLTLFILIYRKTQSLTTVELPLYK